MTLKLQNGAQAFFDINTLAGFFITHSVGFNY
ncbi:uncharacterized protein METZ01_LOCUS458512 [marine metagenome]|uniref:Uncharacterized protein n=1 Tax=marine metagenome TaxID=408172 RepID=A0A383AF04_9ZZZZ